MPWWGWLLVSVLGLMSLGFIGAITYFLWLFTHFLDGW